ncbi:sulfurtransferase TusA family protein [Chelativorans intermedius]|uniref:Sulfurtransferase TusA family protein n=1 Tax=Chelativorans intermedius TaxID=515947 RepID=A0ABV6DAS7_9HYPH|nr:sulfurtransferase TusA family protein [Chelativorans intermedius]MCT8998017.1 sulfurtransferase TusA family protein [Chelativorans intermedius]
MPAEHRESVAVYDLKGLNCPLPVLKARKRLAGMRPGARLWLETTDPLAAIDIPAFCAEAGHRLLERRTTPDGHRFLIERGAA